MNTFSKIKITRRTLLISGSSLALIANILRMVSSLISIPLTLNYLGKERYGLWMITISTLTVISFLDAGIMPVIKNRLSESFAQENNKKFIYYSSSSLAISLIILLMGLLFSSFLSFIDWNAFFKISNHIAQREAYWLVLVVFIYSICSLSFSSIEGIYIARLQIIKVQVYNIISSLTSFSLLLLGISLEVNLPLLACLSSGPFIIFKMVLFFELLLYDKKIIVPENKASVLRVLKEILPISIGFLGIKIAELIISILPNLLIVKMFDLSNVASFNIANKIVTIPLVLLASILPVFWPVFTVAWSSGEKVWLKKKLYSIILLSVFSLTLYTFFIGVFGSSIISWFTKGNIHVSSLLLSCLGLLVIVQSSVYWLSTFLHSLSDFKYEFYCHALTAIILVLTSWVFSNWWGVLGLVLAMCFSWMFGSLFLMIRRVQKWLVPAF